MKVGEDEELDLSDLDLLDGGGGPLHEFCMVCLPPEMVQPLTTVKAICGDDVFLRNPKQVPEEDGRPRCKKCKETDTCPRCGTEFWDMV